jgi:P4 family phage/plasmid primase-like protien
MSKLSNSDTKTTISEKKMSSLISKVNEILEAGRVPPGQQTKITHVSMGGAKGKFNLDNNLRKKLNKALAEATENGVELYIAEMPKEYGPIIFDIDLEKLKTDYKSGRLYDDDMIVETVELYRDAIKKYLLVSDEQLTTGIFEKPKPTEKTAYFKDGFHGFFPNICVSSKVRHLIRAEVVKKAEESETFTRFSNSVNKIFDKSIINTNPWLMYGCKKMDGQVYKLTKVLDNEFNDYGTDYYKDQLHITKVYSIQQKTWCEENSTAYNDNYFDELIDEEYQALGIVKVAPTVNTDLPEDKAYEIEKARMLMTMLKDERAEDYNDWIRVGWALHNIDDSLLYDWIEFSRKSDKFVDGECEDMWSSMKNSGYTIRSLIYWAREDNPAEFKVYLAKEYDTLLRKSLDTNTYYIAKALHNKYTDRFVCVSIRNNVWYEFRNHRWVLSESGVSLFKLISDEFMNDFLRLAIEYNQNAILAGAGSDQKSEFQNKAGKTQKITEKLLNITFKKQIMEEATRLFYEQNFEEKLDEINPHLIGFENGVYDLEKGEFRAGRPDDFISLSTKVNYIPWDMSKKEIKHYGDKIIDFFRKIIVNDKVRKYFLLVLSTCVSGLNKEEKFYIPTGVGSNGKSLTFDLMSQALGEYYAACPITIVTRKRNASNQASPELARLKGRRCGLFSETDENETLNVGILKEITGNDKFMVRPMYREPFEVKFQAKFFLACNKKPNVNAQDYGTWRRLRIIDFASKFVESPDPTKPYEFPLDNTLKQQISKWAPYFASFLIHLYVNEYKNLKQLPTPDEVMSATNSYRNENDTISRFITERVSINKDLNVYVRETSLWEHYKLWIKEQGDDTLKPLPHSEFSKQLPNIIGEPTSKSKGWKGLTFIEQENDSEGNNLDL